MTTRLNLLKHGGTVICTYVLLLRELRHYKHNLTYNKPLIVDDLVEVDSAVYKYVSFRVGHHCHCYERTAGLESLD